MSPILYSVVIDSDVDSYGDVEAARGAAIEHVGTPHTITYGWQEDGISGWGAVEIYESEDRKATVWVDGLLECPRCDTPFTPPGAKSRRDCGEICSTCGTKEALEAMVAAAVESEVQS